MFRSGIENSTANTNMIKTKLTILNRAGLHARAAAKMVSLTARFASNIQIGQDKLVDGKSILSLMMLEASKGTVLNLHVEGDDEDQVVQALQELVDNLFDEEQ